MPTATCPNCSKKDKDKLANCDECDCPSAEQREGECNCDCHKAANCDSKTKKLKNHGSACLLTNREFVLPEDGWYHIAPLGEFSHPKGYLQIVDAESAELIVNRFKADKMDPNFPGILIDYDHFSLDSDQRSEAAGWIEELENRDSGIWAKIRWSDTGEQSVKGGRYRLVSPVWKLSDCQDLGNRKVRPFRIDSVALTNDPNLKGLTPLSNRCAETGSADTPKKDQMDHKLMLVTLLGLAATATDAEIEQSVGLANRRLQDSDKATKRVPVIAAALGLKEDASDEEIVNRSKTLVTENAQFTTERASLIEAQVERDLEEYKDVIGNRDAVKKGLLANRSGMIEVLQALKKPAGSKTPLHNRNTAKNPEDNFDKENDSASTEAERVRAAKISNRATELMNSGKGKAKMTFAAAWRLAEHEAERAELASK